MAVNWYLQLETDKLTGPKLTLEFCSSLFCQLDELTNVNCDNADNAENVGFIFIICLCLFSEKNEISFRLCLCFCVAHISAFQ